MKNNFSPEESLAVIHKMIVQTQDNIRGNSIHFLIWGWTTLFASLSHYILLTIAQYEHPYVAWGLMPVAGVIAAIVGLRQSKKANAKTHLDRSIGFLWSGFGLYLILLLSFMPIIGFNITYPLIIGLYALATFIMGGLIQFNPLKIGGLLCFGIAATSFFLSFPNQLLCIAIAIVVAYLIPGYLLRHKLQK
jgi:hypothetical protein